MQKKEKHKKGLSRLLSLAGEKRALVTVSCLLSGASSAAMLVPFFCVYQILKAFLTFGISQESSAFLIRWGWIAAGAMGLGLILRYVSLIGSHVAAYRVLYGVRLKIARHIGALPLGWLSRTAIGTVRKTLEGNVEQLELFIAHKIPDVVDACVTVACLCGGLLLMSPPLALVCFLSFALGVAVQGSLWFGDRGREFMRRYFDALERVNASAVQYVRGMPAVKIFGRTVESFRGFQKDIETYGALCLQYTDQYEKLYILFKVIAGSFLTLLLPVGLLLLQKDPMSQASALTFLFFVIMAPGSASPMLNLVTLAMTMRQIDEDVERIEAILNEPVIPETTDPKIPESFDITFDSVSFSYQGDQDEAASVRALQDVSFTAPSGKITALVGPSGGGKSTAASLIPRFWDVSSGAVRIGGVDVRDIPQSVLMDQVAFVFQDNFLFFDTVKENIRVGRPGASDEEVFAAAKAARCHDFISTLPQGYDTKIGAGGVYLSGGEEQRITIARAILKDAPILVMDEATAYADPENEFEIQKALSELIQDKTVLVIAHRLGSIRNADQILVLNRGRVVERGKHQELLEKGGLYSRMWKACVGSAAWRLTTGRDVPQPAAEAEERSLSKC